MTLYWNENESVTTSTHKSTSIRDAFILLWITHCMKCERQRHLNKTRGPWNWSLLPSLWLTKPSSMEARLIWHKFDFMLWLLKSYKSGRLHITKIFNIQTLLDNETVRINNCAIYLSTLYRCGFSDKKFWIKFIFRKHGLTIFLGFKKFCNWFCISNDR